MQELLRGEAQAEAVAVPAGGIEMKEVRAVPLVEVLHLLKNSVAAERAEIPDSGRHVAIFQRFREDPGLGSELLLHLHAGSAGVEQQRHIERHLPLRALLFEDIRVMHDRHAPGAHRIEAAHRGMHCDVLPKIRQRELEARRKASHE